MTAINVSIRMLAAAAILSAFAEVGAPASALAQPGAISCNQLWRQRNAIYARAGHCFNTERGRATFGEGCYPPYGRLSGADARRVQQLQSWERRKGC